MNLYKISAIRSSAGGAVYSDDIPVFKDFCGRMDRGEPMVSCEIRMYSDECEYRRMRHEGITVCDDSGKPVKVTGITVDVTDRLSETASDKSDDKDAVTGLLSRKSGEKAVIGSLEKKPSSWNVMLIIFDLDDFAAINEKWGRLYGDFVLETFSNILSGCVLNNDVVYRISGDEFAVLKYYEAPEEIKGFFDNVQKRYNEFAFPRGGNFRVTSGAAEYNEEMSLEELVRRTDIALFNAKMHGRGSIILYSSEMDCGEYSGMTALKDYSSEQKLSVKLLSGSEKKLYDFAFDMFNRCSEPDEALEYIFPEIGKYYNIDNIIIIEKKLSGKVEISHCWRNGDFSYDESSFVYFYSRRWDVLEEFFRTNDYYLISYSHNASDTQKALMEKYHINGAVRCPLFDDNSLAGFISYEMINEKRELSDSVANALCTLSKMLSVYLLKFRSTVKLDNANFYTEAMLENQRLVCYSIDPASWQITYISPYSVNRFPNIKMGEKCFKCIMDDDSPCKNCPIFGLDDNSDRFQNEVYNEKYECWFRCTVTRMKNPEGDENYLVCVNDITSYIERVNSKDRLTGLMTFERFTSDAGKALYSGEKYAVAVISINKFRGINEKYNIRTGNVILTEFAHKLAQSVGPDEFACRWGGGKFILLLKENGSLDNVKMRIIDMMSSGSADIFSITGINVGFYSGVYLIPDDEYQLVSNIDKANFARKSIAADYSAENTVAVYDDSENRDAIDRKRIEGIMQEALDDHEFRAFYQPKVRLADGKITGAEALVRWIRPNGEFISPGKFVPAFEENGFITEMDFEIYRQVFSDLRRWIDEGKNVPVVSVNVSRRHFIGDDFPQKIEALRREYDIPHKYIELEITESMFSNNLNHVINIVNILRGYGFLISVDDFGSGYSNLNLITKMPVDILKVDGGFFINHELSQKDKAVISTIISLAHSLNLYVVSEGIENKIQVDFLNESGCDVVQGFFFYKPMDRESFEKLIENY